MRPRERESEKCIHFARALRRLHDVAIRAACIYLRRRRVDARTRTALNDSRKSSLNLFHSPPSSSTIANCFDVVIFLRHPLTLYSYILHGFSFIEAASHNCFYNEKDIKDSIINVCCRINYNTLQSREKVGKPRGKRGKNMCI